MLVWKALMLHCYNSDTDADSINDRYDNDGDDYTVILNDTLRMVLRVHIIRL